MLWMGWMLSLALFHLQPQPYMSVIQIRRSPPQSTSKDRITTIQGAIRQKQLRHSYHRSWEITQRLTRRLSTKSVLLCSPRRSLLYLKIVVIAASRIRNVASLVSHLPLCRKNRLSRPLARLLSTKPRPPPTPPPPPFRRRYCSRILGTNGLPSLVTRIS